MHLLSCKPHSTLYLVDEQINYTTIEKLKPYNKMANAVLYFSIKVDGKETFNNMNDGEPGLAFTTFFDLDNVMVIDCVNGIDDAIGFSILVAPDSLFVKHKMRSSSTSLMYKFSKDEIPFLEGAIGVKNHKVVLGASKYKSGEVACGYVELSSNPYYQLINDVEQKVEVDMKAYFLSEPLPVYNREYKTLQK